MNSLKPVSRTSHANREFEGNRAKGRRRFIFNTGILRFGVPMVAITTSGDGTMPTVGMHLHLKTFTLNSSIWQVA